MRRIRASSQRLNSLMMETSQELTLQRIKDNCSEQSVKKSAKSYLKNLMTGYKGNLQAFCNNLFSLGQEAAAPQKNGKKRKNTFLITSYMMEKYFSHTSAENCQV